MASAPSRSIGTVLPPGYIRTLPLSESFRSFILAKVDELVKPCTHPVCTLSMEVRWGVQVEKCLLHLARLGHLLLVLALLRSLLHLLLLHGEHGLAVQRGLLGVLLPHGHMGKGEEGGGNK